VISRGEPIDLGPGVSAGFSRRLERAWARGQRYLAGIEPGARQIIARRSQHYVQVTQPGLVIRAARSVVRSVRRADR
jgi:hypothetical protein